MDSLMPLAERIAAALIAQRATIAVAEGSAGGLVSAALLAVPGASAYFLGGAVVYTGVARSELAQITAAEMSGIRAASEPYALLLAEKIRARLGATWGVSETGAAGPTGNRYGDPAGHTCIAVVGPQSRAVTLRTHSADRRANMLAFSERTLRHIAEVIGAA